MSFRIFLLMSAATVTACGAAPTGRSTIPIENVTPIAAGPSSNAMHAEAHVADPTLPDKKVDLAAESTFAAAK